MYVLEQYTITEWSITVSGNGSREMVAHSKEKKSLQGLHYLSIKGTILLTDMKAAGNLVVLFGSNFVKLCKNKKKVSCF